jgi:hypothetical protein
MTADTLVDPWDVAARPVGAYAALVGSPVEVGLAVLVGLIEVSALGGSLATKPQVMAGNE